MASMTVQEMRDYVRLFFDTDEEELPDTLLDVWRDEGVARIQRTFEPWSFYLSTWGLVTATHANLLDSLDDSTFTAESISSVYEPNQQFVLSILPHELALRRYGSTTGTPWAVSVERDTLFLWPTPETTYSYVVRGYRAPVPAVDDTDTVDLPSEFHSLVCEWTLTRAYEQLDDEIMSAQKAARFEQLLDGFRRRYLRAPRGGIEALGSVPAGSSSAGVPDRLRYSWEF